MINMINRFYQFLASMGYPEPLHASNVHIPIGLIVGAFVFGYIFVFFKRKSFAISARHCLVFAFIWFFPTVILGLMDWQHFYHGAFLFPIVVKLILAPILGILLLITIICAYKIGPTAKSVLTLYILCLIATAGLGFFGGRLVFASRSEATGPSQSSYAAGQNLFSENCASCHPKGGNVVKPKLPLVGSTPVKEFNTFVSFIRNPKMPDGSAGQMPKFTPSQISDAQARQLYNYITHVLSKSAKSAD